MIKKVKVDQELNLVCRAARVDQHIFECQFCNRQFQIGDKWARVKHFLYCSTIKKFSGKTKVVLINDGRF